MFNTVIIVSLRTYIESHDPITNIIILFIIDILVSFVFLDGVAFIRLFRRDLAGLRD